MPCVVLGAVATGREYDMVPAFAELAFQWRLRGQAGDERCIRQRLKLRKKWQGKDTKNEREDVSMLFSLGYSRKASLRRWHVSRDVSEKRE